MLISILLFLLTLKFSKILFSDEILQVLFLLTLKFIVSDKIFMRFR